MKKGISKLLHPTSIGGSAFVLAVLTFGAQALALVRDKLFAHTFGAGQVLDVYYSSFRIPDLLYVILSSVVAVTVVLPVLIEHKTKGDMDELRKTINSIFTVFTFLVLFIAMALYILMPILAQMVVPGFNQESTNLFINFSRLLLLSPILLGISNLFGSVAQMYRRFFYVGMAALLYNVGIILGVVLFYPLWGEIGLIAGVIFGACLHLFLQAIPLFEHKVLPRFEFPDFKVIHSVFIQSAPRVATLSLQQVLLFVLTGLASTLSVGSIAIFTFAFNLEGVPLALIGISYSVAAFPVLAEHISKSDLEGFSNALGKATRYIFFWVMPITIFSIVLSYSLVQMIYSSAKFTSTDAFVTTISFILFTLSLLAQAMSLLYVRAHYACKSNKSPLISQIFMTVVSVVLAYVGSLLILKEKISFVSNYLGKGVQPESLAIIAFPFAFCVGTYVGLFILIARLPKFYKKSVPLPVAWFFDVITASTLGGAVSLFVGIEFFSIFAKKDFFGIVLTSIPTFLAGFLVWGAFLYQRKNHEFLEVVKLIQSKLPFSRISVIPPQSDL